MVQLVSLPPTKPAELLKATLSWKESVTTSVMLQWRTKIQFEFFYYFSVTLTLNVINVKYWCKVAWNVKVLKNNHSGYKNA